MIFTHFSEDKNLTLDKIKLKRNNQIYVKPTGFWLGKKNKWYLTWYKYRKEIYKYRVTIDMKDIIIVDKTNIIDFYCKYGIYRRIAMINWKRYFIDNPSCKGIYMKLDPFNYIEELKKLRENEKSEWKKKKIIPFTNVISFLEK